jgi:hypothetical protein
MEAPRVFLTSISRAVRRVISALQKLTPHYWLVRAKREQVAAVVQTLLPAPYDPYALELQTRSFSYDSTTGTTCRAEMTAVFEKLSARAMDRRLGSIGAIEIGAWSVADAHDAFASIDHDVIAGVAQRAHHAINSFSDHYSCRGANGRSRNPRARPPFRSDHRLWLRGGTRFCRVRSARRRIGR